MTVEVHPLADERRAGYSLFVVDHDRAAYSRPLWHFLADCRRASFHPILLTKPNVMLSPHLYTAMAESGAYWAFHDGQGVFDARSGMRIRAFSDLWVGTSAGVRHPPINTDGLVAPTVFFDIYTGGRADDDTVIGQLADHAVGGLGGGPVVRYGRDEPLTFRWNHRALTVAAQQQMPATHPILAACDGGGWVALTVARSQTGLVQRAHGGVVFPQLSAAPASGWRDHVMPMVTTMLTRLVERFRPTVALVSAGLLHRDYGRYGYRAGWQPVDAPLAVLIGPRAVRDLRVDVSTLSARHDVTVVGPGRVPSLLVRMTGASHLWEQLRAFALDLDRERLAAVLSARGQG